MTRDRPVIEYGLFLHCSALEYGKIAVENLLRFLNRRHLKNDAEPSYEQRSIFLNLGQLWLRRLK